MTVVELRCPEKTWRLFGKIAVTKPVITSENLIEFACSECSDKRQMTLHRYDMAGKLIETESKLKEQ